jgi:hypothetical protein
MTMLDFLALTEPSEFGYALDSEMFRHALLSEQILRMARADAGALTRAMLSVGAA